MLKEFDKDKQVTNENILFYNEIAGNYNARLEQSQSSKIIRQKVAEKFCAIVNAGWIMDFGGGTGLDMQWLIKNGYQVLFCEPSPEMRQQAINYNNNILQSSDIHFLDGAVTNFKTWNKVLPFSEKVNAVLSNFAVLNNIYDLELLFENLALVLKPGAHFIALILEHNFRKMVRIDFFRAFVSVVFHKPFTFYVHNNEHKQIVYLHSIKQIKKTSAVYFNFCSVESLPEFGFALIHLTKK